MPATVPPIGHLQAVLTGRVRPFGPRGQASAIAKQEHDGPLQVGALGLDGDEQGDPKVHGGPDKAVHCYPWAHYPGWRQELGLAAAALLAQPGAFGENFCIAPGLDEQQVCIGDRWQIGSAVFELSQGRQPCWKLNERFGQRDMALRVQQSLRAGWYLRVLSPGQVQAGSAIYLLDRPHPSWTVARLLQLIAERECEPDTLGQVLELPLPASWRKLFTRRLESGQVESWQRRMAGEPDP